MENSPAIVIDKMDQCYKDTALDVIKQIPTNASYSEKAKFVQLKMRDKHPLAKWNCQVVRREQGFLSSFDETSQYLVVSFNGDRIDIFVIKTEIHVEPPTKQTADNTDLREAKGKTANELAKEPAQTKVAVGALEIQDKQKNSIDRK